jgi:hypothetical protein
MLRCGLQYHRWQAIEIDGDKGWACRDCNKQAFEREYLERVYDGTGDDGVHVDTQFGGGAHGAAHGPPAV